MLLAAVLSLAIGVVLGMLGGGGSILMLPMLVYAVGIDPKVAIASSLFVVGSTSLVSTIINARARTVEWRVGLTFGAAAMVGAFAGGRLSSLVPATALLLLFATIMLVTAIAMLKGRPERPMTPGRVVPGRVLTLGAGVGVLSGLVGAGGGFLIVPALAIFGRLPINKAIATSIFVIALQSFAGFAGHFGHSVLDRSILAVVTAASVAGVIVGTFAARTVSATNLRRSFAWLVLAMGVILLSKQLLIS